MIHNKIKVIMPIKNVEKINNSTFQKIQQNNVKNLNLSISLPKNSTLKPNIKRLDNRTLNKIIKDGTFNLFDTEDIFEDMMLQGKKIYERLKVIEKKYKLTFKGKDHFKNTIKDYEDEIYNDSFRTSFENLLARKYDYSPFDDYNKYPDFFSFIYRTWELVYLSIEFSEQKYSDVKNELIEKYFKDYEYDFNYIFEKMVDEYLEDYRQYDCVRFNLVKNHDLTIYAENNEFFQVVIGTEELIVPIIYELKNELSSLVYGRKYTVCSECHNLFRISRYGHHLCTDKKCIQARDAKRKAQNKLKNH